MLGVTVLMSVNVAHNEKVFSKGYVHLYLFSGYTQLLQQQIKRKQYTFRIYEAAFKVY